MSGVADHFLSLCNLTDLVADYVRHLAAEPGRNTSIPDENSSIPDENPSSVVSRAGTAITRSASSLSGLLSTYYEAALSAAPDTRTEVCRNLTETVKAAMGFQSQPQKDMFAFYKTAQLATLICLFCLIITANGAVLLMLSLDKKKRKSRMNFFIMNLAIADILNGLVNVLTDIIWKVVVLWYAGDIMCRLVRCLQVVVTVAPTYLLVVMSIDRYDAICRPMNFYSSKRGKLMVMVAWLGSFTMGLPVFILYHLKTFDDGSPQCWISLPEPWQWQLYITLIFILLFVSPSVIIATCYIFIVFTIWKQPGPSTSSSSGGISTRLLNGCLACRRSCKSSHPEDGDADSSTHGPLHQLSPDTGELEPLPVTSGGTGRNRNGVRNDTVKKVGDSASSSRGLIPRAKIKTIYMTITITLVFILCWSPYMIYDILDVYSHIPDFKEKIAVSTFIQSLTVLNSAANPIIYFCFTTSLLDNIRYQFQRCLSACRGQPPPPRLRPKEMGGSVNAASGGHLISYNRTRREPPAQRFRPDATNSASPDDSGLAMTSTSTIPNTVILESNVHDC